MSIALSSSRLRLACVLTKLSLIALSNFLDFSEFLENSQKGNKRKNRGLENQSPFDRVSFSEPERDAAANRTTVSAELRQRLSVLSAWLDIKQIARVEYRFSAYR